jgi:tRNA-specific 2-thiouridylase
MNLWPKNISVKIRARSLAQEAQVTLCDAGKNIINLEFAGDVFGVALGQAAVIYDGDVMLGGGILSGRLDGAFVRVLA